MKIQFETDLDYQARAIKSVVGIFEGQETCQSNFTVTGTKTNLFRHQNELGIGNRQELLGDEILQNIQKIQQENALPESKRLESMDFTIEMETGTGKTYVYSRSIFELNQKYGFSKFIIVVPSIAIKEGIYKSFEMTKEHFRELYDGVNYDYFVYDSSNLEQVRDFATSADIRIMIINIDAFRKSFSDPSKDTKANIIHRTNDKLSGQKPIELIASTNPIVIIDEPQSVDSTDKAKEAIATLNPLCKLRFSATHKEKINLLYKLDSIDAYDAKLVKQIEVASIRTTTSQNLPYIKLLKITQKPFAATIEVDINDKGKTKRKSITVKNGDSLYELTNRDIYEPYLINEIYVEKGNEYISFLNDVILRLGESIGEVDEDAIKRLQIRQTIEEHLDKEMRLNKQNIKVLSLFFIDRVAHYRDYDEDGNPIKGKFAVWFEEEYEKLIRLPKYHTLFEKHKELEIRADQVHDGYFSQDKKGRLKDSTGKNSDDEDAFSKIMKNKERLLSFDEKLRFIFSHSALKEGWDNPNVFQICTLKDGTKSEIRRRQEIGRGLRICVDQSGKRVYGFDVNTLTVMANESYEEFAAGLQKEIENEDGIRFGAVIRSDFVGVTIKDESGETKTLGTRGSEDVYLYLADQGYISQSGKVQDSLKEALLDRSFTLPEEYKLATAQIEAILKKISGNLNIKNRDDKVKLKINKEILLSDEFKELWDRIKYKTTYRVNFDEARLIEECIYQIRENIRLGKVRFLYSKAKNKITRAGIEIDEESLGGDKIIDSVEVEYPLPDIVTYIQNATNLTRKSVVEILVRSKKLSDFRNNPQKFVDECIEIIKKTMSRFVVDGIKYQKIGDGHFYAQKCFEDNELSGYLKNLYEHQNSKSPFEQTIYDSDVEHNFARELDVSPDVKLFAKLPNWFKISTPLGGYNPDWAVLIEKGGDERLYFVVETKGSNLTLDITSSESAKIKCAKAHFEAIDKSVQLRQAKDYNSLLCTLP